MREHGWDWGCGRTNLPKFLYGRGPASAGGRRVHARILCELWLTSAASRKRGLCLNVPKKELIPAASIQQIKARSCLQRWVLAGVASLAVGLSPSWDLFPLWEDAAVHSTGPELLCYTPQHPASLAGLAHSPGAAGAAPGAV